MSKFSSLSYSTLKKILLGSVFEFGPILIFLLSFHYLHIYKATFILMIATIISTIVTYRVQKRLPYVALYVALLTLLFGYITIAHHQPKFIQIRDTMYDATLALTLMIGLMTNISFLKLAFNEVLPMTSRAWTKLTYAWTFFFVLSASANEYIRRTMDLHSWFDFKSLMVIATIIFGCITLFFFYEKVEHHHK